MDVATACAIGGVLVTVLGVAWRLGQLAQRVEHCSDQIKKLQAELDNRDQEEHERWLVLNLTLGRIDGILNHEPAVRENPRRSRPDR